MKNRSIIGLAVAALIVAGCAAKTVNSLNFNANHIKYDVDTRTGLCFAAIGMAKGDSLTGAIGVSDSIGMSHVPCTDKVLKQIPAHKRPATVIEE